MERKSDLPDRTFQFAIEIVRLCLKMEKKPGTPWPLVNQLIKSGTSIGANVEEGQASQSEADFLSKYSIACKEARETLYWLKLLTAAELLTQAEVAHLADECNQIVAILTTIIKKIRLKKQS